LKSFTLLEVIIAVLILFISASIFLEIVGNTRYLVNLYTTYKEKILKSSIVLQNQNTKNAYESLIDFKIDNDEIIHYLKKQTIHIKKIKMSKYEIIDINNIKYYRFY